MKAKAFLAIGLGILVIAFVVIGLIKAREDAPTLGFYALDEASMKAIKALAADPRFSSFHFEFVDMDTAVEPRLTDKGAPSIIFAYDGAIKDPHAAGLAILDDEPISAMPSSLRRVGSDGESRYAYPLLIDHLELAYEVGLFDSRGLVPPLTLEEFLRSARKFAASSAPAIFIAGGDDATLLNLIGALVESRGGPAAAEALASLEYRPNALASLLDLKLGSDAAARPVTLRSELDLLVSLKTEGVLHPEWFRFGLRDLSTFMADGAAPYVLMRLSQRRLMDQRTASRYKGLLFPASTLAERRAPRMTVLTASLNASAPKRHRVAALAFLTYLASAEGQRRLSEKSGLAPTHAAAQAPDEQASELRLWAAASSAVTPEPGWAMARDGASRSALAAELRAYLEAGGAGY
jgi:ABC-type glycerol-3-phosphate transport system substrate-binding protein